MLTPSRPMPRMLLGEDAVIGTRRRIASITSRGFQAGPPVQTGVEGAPKHTLWRPLSEAALPRTASASNRPSDRP